MNLPNGTNLQNGKYQITDVIGQGGFGITYKGYWHTEVRGSLGTVKTEVPICIKEYFFKDYCYREVDSSIIKVHSETGKILFDKFKEKLIKEAKILSEVHHPHIVNVLEVFEENGTAYIAMEYISGYSLKFLLDQKGKLSEKQLLQYVRQVGDALQFVHDKNILHLDIKPSNILIDTTGKARLIDFGVSKRYDIEQQETSTTMLTLSKGFASIEQYDNEGTQVFSPCPDIYSLGATMYNLLTGVIPTESILRATRPLLSPKTLNPEISSQTEEVIIKAMQIVPADRFQSVTDMMAALHFPPEEENEPELPFPHQTSEETSHFPSSELLREEDSEEERTVLNSHLHFSHSKNAKKIKKRSKKAFLFLLLAIFACVASVTIWVKGNKSVFDENKTPFLTDKLKRDTVLDEQKKIPPKTEIPNPNKTKEFTNHKQESEIKNMQQPVSAEKTSPKKETAKKEEKKTVLAEKKEVASVPVQPTEPEMKEDNTDISAGKKSDEEYQILIASGKKKMEQEDYANAEADFLKARDIRLTDELWGLLNTVQFARRKAQYEEKMTFGEYTIVRKKTTRLYGAIDANAKERIPCKYVYCGIADKDIVENGRYFVREDGLYDIYNANGELIKVGSMDY